MKRKHFIALMRALLRTRPAAPTTELVQLEQWQRDCDAIAEVCREHHSEHCQFDMGRWLDGLAEDPIVCQKRN